MKELEMKLEAVVRSAKNKQSTYHEEMKRGYDKKKTPHTFKIGDIVKVFEKDKTSAHKSILPYWKAPYRIIGFPAGEHGVTIELTQYPDGEEIEVVHCQNVEPYHFEAKDIDAQDPSKGT